MKKISLLIIVLLLLPNLALARVGVNVGENKITIQESLPAGAIHKLPAITVINTGDQESQYRFRVIHKIEKGISNLENDWISFLPGSLKIDASQKKDVDVFLNLPVNAKPGNYFATIEVYPAKDNGEAYLNTFESVRFYFSVKQTNFFAGFYYRITTLFSEYSPGGYIATAIVLLMIALWLLSNKFRVKVKLVIKKRKGFFGDFGK